MNEIDKQCIQMYNEHFKNNIKIIQDERIRSLIKTNVNDNYTSLVHRAAKLIIELAGDIKKEEVYFGLFVYLYRNGYLSKDMQFQYGKSEHELEYLLGASVVSGKGVCRNIATLLKDVMNEISSISGNKSKALCVGVNSEHYNAQIDNRNMPQNFQLRVADSTGRSKYIKITREFI